MASQLGRQLECRPCSKTAKFKLPICSLTGRLSLFMVTLFAIIGPSTLVGGAPFGGDSWGDVFRHYKKKFKDKQAAKN